MTWTWDRLESTVTGLGLPPGEHALGFSAWLLVTGAAEQVEQVDLLVSPSLHAQLPSRGWEPMPGVAGGLQRRDQEGLIAVADDAFDFYKDPVEELIAEADLSHGLPVVPVTRAKPYSVRLVVANIAGVAARADGTLPEGQEVDLTVLSGVFDDVNDRMVTAYGGAEELPAPTIPQLGGIPVWLFFALIPVAAGLLALLLYFLGGPWGPVAMFAVIVAVLLIGLKSGLIGRRSGR